MLFKEQLTRLQWLAFGFACLGIFVLTLISGKLPWINLAGSFSLYGVIRKKIELKGTIGTALTALPLVWFAEAAQRMPLSILGFCQYISPTFQFLIAVFILTSRLICTNYRYSC